MWELHETGLPPQHLIIGEPQQRLVDSSVAERMVVQAMSALGEKRSQEALDLMARLTRSIPHHADAWHLLGLAQLEEDMTAQAIASIKTATQLRPDVAFYHSNLAEAYLKAGDLNQARHSLLACLSLDPREVMAAIRLQRLLSDEGSYQAESELFHHIEPAILADPPLAPNDVSTFLQLHAVALVGDKKPLEAVAVLQQAITLFPHDYHAAIKLATCLEEAGLYQEAIDQYMAAVKLKNRVTFRRDRPLHTRKKDRPTVAIYCDEYGQTWWPGWGPSSLGKGLGGSEEAVVFIAR